MHAVPLRHFVPLNDVFPLDEIVFPGDQNGIDAWQAKMTPFSGPQLVVWIVVLFSRSLFVSVPRSSFVAGTSGVWIFWDDNSTVDIEHFKLHGAAHSG